MSLFALGFRPFFLAAGISAVCSVPVWIAVLKGWLPLGPVYSGSLWHAHEMLFGYAAAVIAGFLLTAVRNWTGLETLTGSALAALAGLWLAARLVPLFSVPAALVAAIDVAFFPALALSLYRPLWNGKNKINRAFLVLLAAMTLAAVLVQLQLIGFRHGTANQGVRLMLDLVILTLLIVAGRVMPFFTERAIPGAVPRLFRWVERLSFVVAPAWMVANLVAPRTASAGLAALALAGLQGARLWGWHDRRAWRIPILAVLYSGYVWLVVGFGLDGLAGLGLIASYPALHALSVGAVGVMTLGMMARVALGHTGREMRSSALTNSAFLLLNLSALVRVAGTLVLPDYHTDWILLSGILWTLAFVGFLWIYAPILIAPRIDGRPG